MRRLLRSATEQRESFWNLESVGIQPAYISGEGTDFLNDYQEFSITLIERGYTTKLPSKTDRPPLPTVTQHRWNKNTFNDAASCKRDPESENVEWHYHLTRETGLHRKSDTPRNHCRYLPLTPKPMPCLRNLQPPQYASCTNAAVDNPKNTLALMTVCYQGHLLLMI